MTGLATCNEDIFLGVASFLRHHDLVHLALTCRRFGGSRDAGESSHNAWEQVRGEIVDEGGVGWSLVDEAARQIIFQRMSLRATDSSNEDDVVVRKVGESWMQVLLGLEAANHYTQQQKPKKAPPNYKGCFVLNDHGPCPLYGTVRRPPGESCTKWVATNLIDFYNDISTIWAILNDDPFVASFKPGEGFPAGVQYQWPQQRDSFGEGGHSNGNAAMEYVSISASDYIRNVLQWVDSQIESKTNRPSIKDISEKEPFQNQQFAVQTALLFRRIFKRLFRVYAILYHSFFGTLKALQLAPHLNMCFKHFMFFCFKFEILAEEEMKVVDVLVRPLRKQYLGSLPSMKRGDVKLNTRNSVDRN